MGIKEPYLITSLPFDNSVTYDECGLNYTTYGNPVIKDTSNLLDMNDNKPFKTALYLDGSSYINLNGTILIGGKDLTLFIWFYMLTNNMGWNAILRVWYDNDSNRIIIYHTSGKTNAITTTLSYGVDPIYPVSYERWHNCCFCYVHKSGTWYTYLDGKLVGTQILSRQRLNNNVCIGSYGGENWNGYIKYFKIYDGIAKCTTDEFDVEETYKKAGIQYTTKRNIYHLYNISYDSLYNYNINDSLLYNDTLRDIHKINEYNNNTLRNVLYNINPLYKDTYRYIKRINKYNNITKRNIKHDYINILYNTKRIIHNNINIINYVHRHKVRNGNNTNDTVRSVISWKHKIIAFITNPRYRLR